MFAKIGKVLFIGCMFAAILLAACEREQQGNPNAEFEAAKAAQAQKEATGNPLESVANAAEPTAQPTEPTITAEEAQAQEAAKAQAVAARKKAQEAAKDPCRKLVCSTDDEPWRGCYYAAALYRDAPGTVPGVRHVVSILKPDQVMWYRGALLASYRRDLWFSMDYRMGDATDLNQSARDVRVGILGDKDTDAMSEGVVCGLLGSTDITLADIIAASRMNSPFVGTKKEETGSAVRYMFMPATPTGHDTPALPAEIKPATPSCGADPCPPTSDPAKVELETLDDEVEPGPSGDQVAPATTPPVEGTAPATPPATDPVAPATPGCGADPCPPPANPVPAEPPAGEIPPATPAFDPTAVPSATNPVPAEPPADAPAVPATDPADPSEPEGAAPPPNDEGTVAYNSGEGF